MLRRGRQLERDDGWQRNFVMQRSKAWSASPLPGIANTSGPIVGNSGADKDQEDDMHNGVVELVSWDREVLLVRQRS